MILTIPDSYLDEHHDRTDNMIQQAMQRWGRVTIGTRTYDNPMHVAARYGCKDYKRKDWKRIAYVSGSCLELAVTEMMLKDGITTDTKEIMMVSRNIRLAAGRHLSYTGDAVG